jgi:hypothetical protein
MRNILLFGPPASGKLSIASALADMGSYVVVDNHRTIDAANLINERQKSAVPQLSEKLREWLYKSQDIKIVATVVYVSGIDDDLITKYKSWLDREGSPVLLVQLHCSRDVVIERCGMQSRIGSSKITDTSVMKSLYAKYNFDSNHPDTSIMHLDTQCMSALDAAAKIWKIAEQGDAPDAQKRAGDAFRSTKYGDTHESP